MQHPDTAIVTGAFSYTGRYVARRLLDEGVVVRTLTRSPDRRDPFGGLLPAAPLDFSDPDGLFRSMQGARVLYNTYWVRFGRGRTTFNQAVENSKALFEAAAKAGVGRIVHFSVANAASESRLPYFRGKGQVEEILRDTGIPYAIIRPTLVFGQGDLLLNNMAWALRRFPLFPVFGRWRLPGPAHLRRRPGGPGGGYAGSSESRIPLPTPPGAETFTFEELLRLLASAVGARVRLVHTPPTLGFALTRMVGLLLTGRGAEPRRG